MLGKRLGCDHKIFASQSQVKKNLKKTRRDKWSVKFYYTILYFPLSILTARSRSKRLLGKNWSQKKKTNHSAGKRQSNYCALYFFVLTLHTLS